MIGAELTIAGPRPLRGRFASRETRACRIARLLFGGDGDQGAAPSRTSRTATTCSARAPRWSNSACASKDSGPATVTVLGTGARRTARAGRRDRLRQLGHDDAHARRPARRAPVPDRAQRRRVAPGTPDGTASSRPSRAMGARIDGRDDGDLAPLVDPRRRPHRSPDRARRPERAGEDGGDPRGPPGRRSNRDRRAGARAAITASACSKRFGARRTSRRRTTRIETGVPTPFELDVPGDPSSAAFFAVAACITPGSELVIEGVASTRPHRASSMSSERWARRSRSTSDGGALGEPVGDIGGRGRAARRPPRSSPTKAMIDEIPALAIAAAFADGAHRVPGHRASCGSRRATASTRSSRSWRRWASASRPKPDCIGDPRRETTAGACSRATATTGSRWPRPSPRTRCRASRPCAAGTPSRSRTRTSPTTSHGGRRERLHDAGGRDRRAVRRGEVDRGPRRRRRRSALEVLDTGRCTGRSRSPPSTAASTSTTADACADVAEQADIDLGDPTG